MATDKETNLEQAPSNTRQGNPNVGNPHNVLHAADLATGAPSSDPDDAQRRRQCTPLLSTGEAAGRDSHDILTQKGGCRRHVPHNSPFGPLGSSGSTTLSGIILGPALGGTIP
jgi:hypothetical protein